MPNPATDRQRFRLIATAIVSVAMTAFALRTIARASTTASKPLPTADVQSLTGFLGPLTDSSSLAGVRPGTMVGDRDPFGSVPSPAGTRVSNVSGAVSRPKTAEGRRWVVSSILFEDSRRSAIVNNTWVSVGDPLGGGARVTAIERKHVVVTDANGIRHVVPIQGGA
jgi:hypothetical protein